VAGLLLVAQGSVAHAVRPQRGFAIIAGTHQFSRSSGFEPIDQANLVAAGLYRALVSVPGTTFPAPRVALLCDECTADLPASARVEAPTAQNIRGAIARFAADVERQRRIGGTFDTTLLLWIHLVEEHKTWPDLEAYLRTKVFRLVPNVEPARP